MRGRAGEGEGNVEKEGGRKIVGWGEKEIRRRQSTVSMFRTPSRIVVMASFATLTPPLSHYK